MLTNSEKFEFHLEMKPTLTELCQEISDDITTDVATHTHTHTHTHTNTQVYVHSAWLISHFIRCFVKLTSEK
jgi:hypothetical protein